MSRLEETPSSNSLQSTESDTEFWAALDSKPSIFLLQDREEGGAHYSPSHKKGFDDAHSFDVNVELIKRAAKHCANSPLTEAQIQRQFERSLDMIRKAKNIELANSSVLMKHSLTKEFEVKLEALKRTFVQQKEIYRRDVEFLKVELTKKTTESMRLLELVAEQESLITQLRLLSRRGTSVFSVRESEEVGIPSPTDTAFLATSEFLAEIEVSKMQIDSMKVMIDQYKRESEEKSTTCKELQSFIEKLRTDFERERRELNSELEELREKYSREKQESEERFRVFRGEANTESLMHEEIQKRLQGVIATLQEELRTAKLVLTHPRLRNKVFTRLKDVETAVMELRRTPISQSPSTPGSRSTRLSRGSFLCTQQTHTKAWNPQDHKAYLQSAELENTLERSFSSRKERTGSAHPSVSVVEGRKLAVL